MENVQLTLNGMKQMYQEEKEWASKLVNCVRFDPMDQSGQSE